VLVTGPLFGLVLPPQAPNGNGHMPAAANGASANGHMPAAANGAGADGHAAGTNGSNAAAPRLRYREGLGGLGFQVQIDLGEPIEVVAGSLLKRSPHVLYTNVVESLLRWTFAELGFALVHAACIAKDGRAFLITARTDTGKTTTCLQTLDSRPYAFLSDDLVLVTPDGRVFTYPKPLTISRHTLHAVKTPLLTRRERTALVVQSRLHSRSGRRFAMFMARTGLPAATINAIVQLLVPPPKYQVDRLVPGVEIAPEAQIAGMVIIQRGGTGTEQLAPEDALDILLSNCEDAYGFPPYSEIEHFLHTRGDSDLRALERQTIANALQDIPTTLMRSDTMDWWQRLPEAIEPRGDREASDRG